MAINTYQKLGNTYYQVYVAVRSKINPKVRVQIRTRPDCSIKTLAQAQKEEKKLLVEASQRVTRREAAGSTWEEVIYSWDKHYKKYPSRKFGPDTRRDHISRMENWTPNWMKKVASEISIGDAREILRSAYDKGASFRLRRAIKGTINILFKWGIEEGYITNCNKSPAQDIEIDGKIEDKMPEILTRPEIVTLLHKALTQEHPWYPVWKFGFLSGLRTSEIEALRKKDIELISPDEARELERKSVPTINYGIIRVERSWKTKQKCYGPTKGNYWRNVPINKELYWFFIEYLKNDFGQDEHGQRVFPILPNWRRGEQAKVLRFFCEVNGLKSIKFHTIRACFATQLLSKGVPAIQVMKVGGWKDLKTMMIYVRLAGIEEAGATAKLSFEEDSNSSSLPPTPSPSCFGEMSQMVESESNVLHFANFR